MAGTLADKSNLALANHDAIKQALIDMGQNPSDAMSTWPANIRAIVGNGGGSGDFVVSCGTPLNIRIEDNKVKWDAPDVSAYTDYTTSFKYYISVNGAVVTETTETFYSLNGYADGDITVQLYALLFVTAQDQSDTVTSVLAFVFQGTYARLDDLSVTRYASVGAGTTNNFAVFMGGFSSYEVDAYNMALSGARTVLANAANHRQCHRGTGVNTYAIVSGGYDGYFINKITCYDMVNGGTQTALTVMSVGRGKHAMASILGYVGTAGGAYQSSGTRTTTVDKYDSNNGFAKAVLPNLPYAVEDIAGAGAGGYFVFGGGYDGTARRAEVRAYNPLDNVQTTLTNLGIARSQPACASVNNFVVFAGGLSTATGRSGAVDAYDMSQGGVRTALTSIIAGSSIGAAGSSGSVIFAGGSSGTTTYTNTVTRYDMRQGGLKTSLQNLLNSKHEVGAAGTEKYVVLAGGYNGAGLPEVEAYNIAAS
jgi:hypothetical protein